MSRVQFSNNSAFLKKFSGFPLAQGIVLSMIATTVASYAYLEFKLAPFKKPHTLTQEYKTANLERAKKYHQDPMFGPMKKF